MTARRAVVVHDPCPHGTHLGPHYTDPAESVESLCEGGAHRVLVPGRYVLVERDENGEWPVSVLGLSSGTALSTILDALAQEPT